MADADLGSAKTDSSVLRTVMRSMEWNTVDTVDTSCRGRVNHMTCQRPIETKTVFDAVQPSVVTSRDFWTWNFRFNITTTTNLQIISRTNARSYDRQYSAVPVWHLAWRGHSNPVSVPDPLLRKHVKTSNQTLRAQVETGEGGIVIWN